MIQFVQKRLHCLTVAFPLAIVVSTVATAQTAQTKPSPGCLSGYPDGTYQGDRPLTRNEFAAGMNACLDQVN